MAQDGEAVDVSERQVTISTPDGSADALLFAPQTGRAPAVILWADIGGLRPAIADLGRKLAKEGYVVLAPNAFYRSVRLDGTAVSNVDGRTRFVEWRGAATDRAIASDGRAYVAFLDAQPGVDRSARIGAVGYDIGAAYSFILARSVPGRVGAVSAIHPSAVATTRDNSPHLFVGQSKAAYYVALAADDDAREPEDKDLLRDEFEKAGLTASVEVLAGNHGFGLPDHDAHETVSAEQGWRQTISLLRGLSAP